MISCGERQSNLEICRMANRGLHLKTHSSNLHGIYMSIRLHQSRDATVILSVGEQLSRVHTEF